MKKYANLIMLVLCLVFISPVFAQHGHYHDYDRYAYKSYDYKRYVPVEYSYHPYRYYPPVAVRPSVSVIAQLPFGAVAVNFGGRPYHYYNGLYYSPMTGGYMMVEPPMGIVVPVLPPSAVNIIIGGTPYYRYQSVFYLPLGNNGYQVVIEPKAQAPVTNQNT